MKSKDFQKLVLSKSENGDGTTKIFRDLNGATSLSTIERCCRRIREVGTIDLVNSRECSRIIRTKAAIQKVKRRLNRRKPLSSRKLARESGISRSSVQRILKSDLELQAYKIQKEPLLTDSHKEKRTRFANWIRTNFRKENTMNILFSGEKMFDIDGAYNSQNDRIWAVYHL
ncbi:unnamed protein product [Rotaria socialis]|uniref:Transposase Tc1-like domain-containing protein n=1 Tax=Rotaria socialis TaxID=392032 RepID=A0A818TLX3_9BILA|nr:unnamed protein product [Rotaria socialis]